MKILVLLMLSFPLFAGNGNEVGNGGDGLICGDKIQIFDFYETKQLKKYHIDFPGGSDWNKIANTVVTRLKNKNENLYRQYSKVLAKINKRLKFIDEANFRDVKDSYEVAIPKDCRLEQLAIQKDNSKGEREIFISLRLWKKLSEEQKAGLIMHEIIYEHFINLGEKNSLKVREFNSLLFSKEIGELNRAKFNQIVRSMKLSLY